MRGGGRLHAVVLCGWKDRCEVSAVHGEGNGDTKSTRVGHAARQSSCRRGEPMIEGGSPPPMVVACKRGHGTCCGRG